MERDQAEHDHERAESDALLEAIRLAPDAVVMVDREGRITYWNTGAQRIFGYPPEEAVGSSLDLIIPERLRARHWEAFNEAVRTGQSRYGASDLLAVPATTADGRKVSIEFTVALVAGASGIDRVAAFIRDVTERRARDSETRRRLQELEQRAAAEG